MKKDKLFTLLTAWALAFLLSVSAVLCLATGFSLTVDKLTRLVFVCGITALAGGCLFQWRRGGLVFLLVTAFLSGYLWRLGIPDKQLLALLRHISQVYDNAYHWGVLPLSDFPQSADYPLMMVGYLCAAAVSRCICRGRGTALALLCTLTPLFACLVVTDTVPQAPYLFALLAGLAILLLTANVRRQSIAQGNRLAAMAALPVAAVLAVLFLMVPQKGYVNRSNALREQLLTLTDDLTAKAQTTFSQLSAAPGDEIPKTLELTSLGKRIQSPYPVMTVAADFSGTVYLRGQDYDGYTGTSWTADADRAEVFTQPDSLSGTVTIRTRSAQEGYYLPYYPGTEVSLSGGSARNPEGILEYSFPLGSLSDAREAESAGKYGILPDAQRYLALPEQTREAARSLLDTMLTEHGSNSDKAGIIAAHVRSAAEYDLTPDIMRDTDRDFALWFLEEADRGYCVHFATAATVLLRAADIPARYVTGYMVQASAGETVTVTEENAHAWAEYYEPRLDAWMVLEATPAAPGAVPQTQPETEAVPTEETLPETAPSQSEPAKTEPETTAPAATEPEEAESSLDLSGLKTLAQILMGAGAALLLLSAQRSARLALRRRRQSRGAINTRALERWREAELLSRLLKEPPTEELLALAQKAKFSQHDLTAEELNQLDAYLRTCRQQLRQKPWYIRIAHQYIFAAY